MMTTKATPLSSSTTETKLRDVIQRWRPELASEICSIVPITPDASLRRYFRVNFSQIPPGLNKNSIVAMIFDSVAGAEVGSAKGIDSDVAYVDLTNILLRFQISVPYLYFDARDCSILLIEDVGEILLAQTIIGDKRQSFRNEDVDSFYRQAIDEILKIMAIPVQAGLFAFERKFTKELYLREMDEFREFVLTPLSLSIREFQSLDRSWHVLAEELAGLPMVLVHRDFHSWNLLLDEGKKIRIVDFQDALLGTKMYDLVSLLNDRDTDAALGRQRYEMLLNYFFEHLGSPADFFREYNRVLLQRDLKVAGRFSKLSRVRGLQSYERWIPGTLSRIGKTLTWLSEEEPKSLYPGLRDLFEGKFEDAKSK